jgi:hypothetical protein
MVGRASVVNRQLASRECGVHGATDPCAIGVATDRNVCDASVVVKVLSAALDARRVRAGSEGVEPPARGVGDRSATTGSSPLEDDTHDGVRVMKVRTTIRR